MSTALTTTITAAVLFTALAIMSSFLLHGWIAKAVVFTACWTILAMLGELADGTRQPDIYRSNVRVPAILTVLCLMLAGLLP